MENRLSLEEGFYLEEWFVEPEICRVSGQGKHVRVEPKVMDVLILLALNQNRVLRKGEIISHVWGEVSIVENVLSRAISEIRKIFGDDARQPKIIQTIPKVGYRLIAKVSQDREAAENVTDFDPSVFAMPTSAYTAEFNDKPLWRGAGLVLLIIAALLIMALTLAGRFERRVVIKKVILRPAAERPSG